MSDEISRSSQTGRFVSEEEAKAHPDVTQTETVTENDQARYQALLREGRELLKHARERHEDGKFAGGDWTRAADDWIARAGADR